MLALGMPGAFDWLIMATCLMPTVILCWLPYFIARRKQSPDAMVIGVLGFVGAIVFPVWIVALIWALTARDWRQESQGFPVVRPPDHEV